MIICKRRNKMERNLTMLMDYYQLLMAALYFEAGLKDKEVTFDLFFRKVPDMVYAIFD